MTVLPTNPLHLTPIPMVDKTAWIVSKVRGKRVLHVGPSDSPETAAKAKEGRLLHIALQGQCRELVGLDLDADAIRLLRDDYNITDIIHGNAENLSPALGKFDIVIAGDVVEHMNNVGLFFEGVKTVLDHPNGELLVTVPNAFAIKRMLGAIALRQERNNPDHLYFFSAMTFHQIAHRFGFDIAETCGFMYDDPRSALNRWGGRIARTLIALFRNNHLADELAVSLRVTSPTPQSAAPASAPIPA